MLPPVSADEAVRSLVHAGVQSYAAGFSARHEGERHNPEGTLNMKIHNVFIAALGVEIQYYTALVRSLDSSLGNMLEKLAINIAKLYYDVERNVQGPLSPEQTIQIAELLEQYKSRTRRPGVGDYLPLRESRPEHVVLVKRHDSDYYLTDRETGHRYLIELKIGGDLDNKKARSEKEAILEQYAILSNVLPKETPISIYFATAYNRFGEGKPWLQERVRQFFAPEELLIGRDFWNLVCKSEGGYDIVLKAYRESAHHITEALDSIKLLYLS
ncbi:MAG TPA: TdeIII family type II restriction endonuclease [Dehalococcoidia bacterium]